MLASFFYGYVITQVLGGVLSDRTSPKLLFGCGLSVLIILTILTPISCGVVIRDIKIFGICAVRFGLRDRKDL